MKKSTLLCVLLPLLYVLLSAGYYAQRDKSYGQSTLFESDARDLMVKFRYWLRNKNHNLDVNRDVTVIGIDDKSLSFYGRMGANYWQVRAPYSDQATLLGTHFKPLCLSYDILFKPTQGEVQVQDGTKDIIEDLEMIEKLSLSLKGYATEGEEVPIKNILRLSSFLAEYGEYLLADKVGTLSVGATAESSGIPVIGGFHYRLPGKVSAIMVDDRPVEIELKDQFLWTQEDILGDDPDDLSEEYGLRISYLLQQAIPLENISAIPDDYNWAIDADMVSLNFRDVMQQAFINGARDSDGVLRRLPLVLGTKYYNPKEKKLKQVFTCSLSLASVLHFWGADFSDVYIEFGKAIRVKTKRFGERVIPIDNEGNLLLNYMGKDKDYNYVPFHSLNRLGFYLEAGELTPLMKQQVEHVRESIDDNICLVGVTYTANPDTGATSLENTTSYVYGHVAAIDNMLSQRFLIEADYGKVLGMLIGLALVIIMSGISLPIWRFALLIFLLIVCYIGFVIMGIYYSWLSFPILMPIIFVSVSFFTIFLIRYIMEERDKNKIKGMFSTMVSGEVLDYMEKNPESFSLSGKRVNATMMFSDVAGFTTISEGLSPEKLVELLNKYLTPMTDIILNNKGYVDKYEGDAIMAEWGAVTANERHAELACLSCLQQQEKLSEIRQALYEEFGYELRVRFGLNSGDVVAGNMGSDKRFSYTVMGDAVNLAARLEPTNKVYGTELMIGENTYELAKDKIEARLIDKIVVTGKSTSIKVYELLAMKGAADEETLKMCRLYEAGLALHEQRQWDEAIAVFEKALEIQEDQPSKVMIQRCEEYKITPPNDTWQGEYVRKSKD